MRKEKNNPETEQDVEYWKKKYKILNKKFITVLIIMVISLTSTIGMFGYAAYVTRTSGAASAQVAQWNVQVTLGNNGVDGEFTDGVTIDMATTKVSNLNVQSDKIAPGDKGQIILNIDATGCETAVTYIVTMDQRNMPTNMNFYSDPGYSVPISTENGIITLRKTLSLDDIEDIQTEVIYWEWPFTTGTTQTEKDENDEIDTVYGEAGETLTASLSITVAQVNGYGAGETLASIGRVGEYVNYDASSGSGAGLSITPQASQTGSNTLTTFNSSDIKKWRIYDIDSETGVVTLIAADPTTQTLTLSNKTGWKNAVNVLNSIGAIYGHGNGATGGRSIQETDISAHSSYNPANYRNENHSTNGTVDGYYYYTGNENRVETENYTSGTFIMDDNSEVSASAGNPVTMRQTYYGYTANTSLMPNPYYNMIFKQSTNTSANKPNFWVAARYVNLYSSYCNFNVRAVYSGSVRSSYLYGSAGYVDSPSYAVVPMVTLQSNIHVSGMDANGVWLLDTSNN